MRGDPLIRALGFLGLRRRPALTALALDAAAVVGELRRHPLQVRGPLVELRLQRRRRIVVPAVIGLGGVGLASVLGAVASGAQPSTRLSCADMWLVMGWPL